MCDACPSYSTRAWLRAHLSAVSACEYCYVCMPRFTGIYTLAGTVESEAGIFAAASGNQTLHAVCLHVVLQASIVIGCLVYTDLSPCWIWSISWKNVYFISIYNQSKPSPSSTCTSSWFCMLLWLFTALFCTRVAKFSCSSFIV